MTIKKTITANGELIMVDEDYDLDSDSSIGTILSGFTARSVTVERINGWVVKYEKKAQQQGEDPMKITALITSMKKTHVGVVAEASNGGEAAEEFGPYVKWVLTKEQEAQAKIGGRVTIDLEIPT